MRFALPVLLLVIGSSACELTSEPEPPPNQTTWSSQALIAQEEDVPPREVDWGATWEQMSADALWEHVASRDMILVLGLKEVGAHRGAWRDSVLISDVSMDAAVRTLQSMGIPVLYVDSILPWVALQLEDPRQIELVRKLAFSDYLEPLAIDVHYNSGCAWEGWSGSYPSISSGDALPPNYLNKNTEITKAWTRSQGSGVVIGLADTGISPDQAQLLANFSSGESGGRWKHYTGIESYPWYETGCSHGTRMAAAMVAPLDGRNMVGVAYKANLISVHQADGVWSLFGSSVYQSVRIAASHDQGNYPFRRIVTMAFEADDGYNNLADEIRYWEAGGRLFIGASGNVDMAGIAFPAKMTEVLAVSVVSASFQEISGINYGSEVELSFIENQLTAGATESDISSLSLTSGATAIVSGIAALTWSRFPTESNYQIRDRLRSAGHQYPSHDRVRGYGVLDALKAVGGMYALTMGSELISGSPKSSTETWRLSTEPRGGTGPFGYLWGNGAKIEYIDVTVDACGDPSTHGVTVTDQFDDVKQHDRVTIYPSRSGTCDDPW